MSEFHCHNAIVDDDGSEFFCPFFFSGGHTATMIAALHVLLRRAQPEDELLDGHGAQHAADHVDGRLRGRKNTASSLASEISQTASPANATRACIYYLERRRK